MRKKYRDLKRKGNVVVFPTTINRLLTDGMRLQKEERYEEARDGLYQVLTYAQVMLPVWLLTVTYKQKPYQVFINGITGEVQGYRPWSAAKIAALAILAAIVIGVLIYLYVTNQ